MAQPVMAQPAGYYGGGYGNEPQPGYGGPSISSNCQQSSQRTTLHVQTRGNRKRLSQEGWCWVILLLLLCWPLCWLPFVMDQCYEYY